MLVGFHHRRSHVDPRARHAFTDASICYDRLRMAKPRHQLRRLRDAIELSLYTGAPVAGTEVRRALEVLAVEVGAEEARRVDELAIIADGQGDRGEYRERHGVAGVRRFVTAGGATIYLLAAETFPDHVNNVYLIRDGRRATLYDCGSQMESTQADLSRAHTVMAKVYDEPRGLDGVGDVILSHAHIDHFGGVGRWKARGAKIHVHEFDARVITKFEERIVVAAMQLRVFLERAGVDERTRAELEQMYVFTKSLFKSVPIDHVIGDGANLDGYVAHHAPGHCPGQICLQVHNVLLTADHVLPRITPHQSPESITPWTGLDHYFIALEKLRHIGGIDLALPGHEEPIARLSQRIAEIVGFHEARLAKVRALTTAPKTIAEIAGELFGAQPGYGRLLALEEAAAHVEYLSRRGVLEIDNLGELVQSPNPVLRYRSVG
jgi:glyoxylase-like metal-dependent hydrolase (beta-lactamase superfamily II)